MGILPMLPKEIQLTDAQQAQLGTITGAHRDEWKALAGRERAAHEALNAAVTAENATGNVDETVIRQRSAEVAAVDADMAVARAHVHAEVWQILTADQKAKLAQLKAAVSARRPSPRGPR